MDCSFGGFFQGACRGRADDRSGLCVDVGRSLIGKISGSVAIDDLLLGHLRSVSVSKNDVARLPMIQAKSMGGRITIEIGWHLYVMAETRTPWPNRRVEP